MTTIIAIRSATGLVMGSDLQETGSDVQEYASKISKISPHELLACAGVSEFIPDLTQHIAQALANKGENQDYRVLLNEGIDSFDRFLSNKIDTERLDRRFSQRELNLFYPQGIYAAYDNLGQYRIFEFDTPLHCLEVNLRDRAAKGSGGTAATVFLKTAEVFFGAGQIENGWKRFSNDVVRQIIYVLLDRIRDIDPYTSGFDIRVMTPQGIEGISPTYPVFPKELKPYKSHFAELVDNVRSEISPQMPAYMLERWGLLDVLKKMEESALG